MRILITGSTGLLAKGFEETSDGSHQLVGVHLRSYQVKDTRARHLTLDVRDAAAVDELFGRESFDAVIHAAGLAAVDHVEKHPEEGRRSNIEGTRNIARACRRCGAYMVYVSTNAVFDGAFAPYAEDASTNPIHEYGRIKLECERLTKDLAGPHAIVRPILMYGWNHSVNRPNPVTWLYEKLLRGEPVPLVGDVFENPLHSHQCGRALWKLLEKRPAGIFHLAGADRVSRWELGLKAARAFDLDASLLSRVDSSYFPSIAPRPKDTTFTTRRMEAELGMRPLTLEEGLQEMKAEMGIGV